MEARPSFSPPRRDLRPADSDPGATQYYSQRLDILNTKYDRLLEQLSQRLKTAIEVNGSDGLVSFAKFLSYYHCMCVCVLYIYEQVVCLKYE